MDSREPTIHEPDPILGWKNKVGQYVYPGYVSNSKNVKVTFLANGVRDTGGGSVYGRKKLAVVGGSFIQGWAISDNETLAYKLQGKFPFVKVLNYGTAAYGTYQCLLSLEKRFSESQPPAIVLYGFMADHQHRNVAIAYWLAKLAWFSKRGHVCVPYCTLDEDGNLKRHPPESYPVWPFRKYSALVNWLEQNYMIYKTSKRSQQQRIVTEKLLLEMNDLCRNNDTKFIVALLVFPGAEKKHYINFLRQNHLNFIDCVYYPLTTDVTVAGEGHPNGKLNTFWADRIAEAIGDTITGLGTRK